MDRSTWKKFERRVAGYFGSKRKPGSGSMGHDDDTTSDSKHPALYIECKARKTMSLITLWHRNRKRAEEEGKTLVIAVHATQQSGDFLFIRKEDFDTVAVERAKALKELI